MSLLDSSLRKQLEKTVIEARAVAEQGARAALARLAVGEREPYKHLSAAERALRNRLRAHGRQLGDRRLSDGTQDLTHLVWETAYEHWHRMLFARFLAENSLLIHPDHEVAISLDEVAELAAEEGDDPWDLAGRYAARMLPQIFRPDDPVLALAFAPEHRQPLEALLEALPPAVFTASDSLGWVYQFWQAARKEEVNRSENKIGADELPAVTQLFTENYMVRFLLHNTVGAWWAGRRKVFNGITPLKDDVTNEERQVFEDSLRRRTSDTIHPKSRISNPKSEIPNPKSPYHFEFLRFLPDGRPAAGTFDGWPDTAAALRVLDPCCGSGHFLVEVFHLLARLRMVEEGLPAAEAADAVLRDNIFGLEIDPRCTQIAAFALALAAWQFPARMDEAPAPQFRPLPPMHIACSGLALASKREEWLRLARGDSEIQEALDGLWQQFQDAPVLGSLIQPHRFAAQVVSERWGEALERERAAQDYDAAERGVAARGLADAAALLAGRYTLVITNVPYLARGKQGDTLKEFIAARHPAAKADLATAFVERAVAFCARGGTAALVTPQNWLFLGSYKKLREHLLMEVTWNVIAKLGPKAFQTPMWDFNVMLSILTHARPDDEHQLRGLDASGAKSPSDKSDNLYREMIKSVLQSMQIINPDSRIVFESNYELKPSLGSYCECFQGIRTGDRGRFIMHYFEVIEFFSIWDPYRNSTSSRNPNDGIIEVIRWDKGKGGLHKYAIDTREKLHDMHESGNRNWGKLGVAINQMAELKASRYFGEKYDGNVNVIVPFDQKLLTAIWCYCSSEEYNRDVRKLDQKLNVTNATLIKVAFDLEHWMKVASAMYPDGLPEPLTNDPTQWLFKGHVTPSDEPLQVAVARLLGYRWPEQEEDSVSALADDDGIVPLVAVRGERPAAERLREVLVAAYGKDWSPQRETQLLADADFAGQDLEDWLRNGFFEQHFQLFHHRPFIWHVWDGLRDGFGALVNYHRLNAKLLDTLTYTYLGDWLRVQRDAQKRGVAGAERKVLAAEALQRELEKIKQGEPPYDIFVRWKPLHEQPVGWEPDLNDGVRMNIRPWMTAELPGEAVGRSRGVGVLRWAPNIKWTKDRGKEPKRAFEDFPWFWTENGKEFHGNRENDIHLTRAEKEAARKAKSSKGD